MANELPSNVSYGTVTGRFLLAYDDSTDLDLFPDGAAAKGYVLFTPSPIFLKNTTASPAPATILPATVQCSLDSEGYILGTHGGRGVRLVATDDPDNNPQDWTWKVTFRLTDQSDTPVRTIPDFSFELPGGETVDLTSVAPMPDANGTFYLTGPTGPSNVLTVGTVTQVESTESADVTITGESPAQVINFEIPKGPANVLSIGTVSTGAAGTNAAATITGTTPAQVLNLTIPQGLQGIQGIQGETGPVGPTGATGIEWQGTWSSTTDYVNNDAVYYDGASWFASGDPTVGEVPSLSATHWFPLALQGATGATGPQGEQGIQGIQGPPGSAENISATSPIVYDSNTSTISFDSTLLASIDGGTA